MRIALDTNVLAYAEGVDDDKRRDTALRTVEELPQDSIVIPVQVLGELFNVLTRRGHLTRMEARPRVRKWRTAYPTLETSASAFDLALDLATDHQFRIWDAFILSVASGAGCRLLLSEDMQDGFVWGGVTVINPFAANPHPLLTALLSD
jgi:predicted nucleic acid-binding protein